MRIYFVLLALGLSLSAYPVFGQEAGGGRSYSESRNELKKQIDRLTDLLSICEDLSRDLTDLKQDRLAAERILQSGDSAQMSKEADSLKKKNDNLEEFIDKNDSGWPKRGMGIIAVLILLFIVIQGVRVINNM